MYLLVICEIVGLFFNTLVADDKYSLRNSEKLPQPIQMELFKKQKSYSEFFCYVSDIYIKFLNF